jgi:signal recognition particle GTPase
MKSEPVEILAIVVAEFGEEMVRRSDVENFLDESGVSDLQFEILGKADGDAADGINLSPRALRVAAETPPTTWKLLMKPSPL